MLKEKDQRKNQDESKREDYPIFARRIQLLRVRLEKFQADDYANLLA